MQTLSVHATLSLTLAHLGVAMGIACCWIAPASASLGGNVDTIVGDAAAEHGAIRSSSRQSFEVREITGDTGVIIREFLDKDGTVFAVAWSGPRMPDLRRLLGQHFAAYSTALSGLESKGPRRFVRVSADGLVVESAGHMWAFSGRAYLSALLPAGATAADIL